MRNRSEVCYDVDIVSDDGDTGQVESPEAHIENDTVPEEIPINDDHALPSAVPSAGVHMEIVDDAIIDEVHREENQYEKGNRDQLFHCIQEKIIDGNWCISMKMLTESYGFDGTDRRKRHYVKKVIELEFGERLIFITILNEPQVVVRAGAQSTGEIVHQSNKHKVLKMAADILREDVDLFIGREKELDNVWPPTPESLLACRERYPDSLDTFFNTFLKPRHHSPGDNVCRATKSMSDDVVHFLSNGNILTLKHTLVACGLHSMSGSSKLVKILHRLNNSCSYDRVREIETAQAEAAQKFSRGTFPLPLAPRHDTSNVLLRVWWDKFDSMVENKEGSLHTCHGVAYTEKSSETVERNIDDVQVSITKNDH